MPHAMCLATVALLNGGSAIASIILGLPQNLGPSARPPIAATLSGIGILAALGGFYVLFRLIADEVWNFENERQLALGLRVAKNFPALLSEKDQEHLLERAMRNQTIAAMVRSRARKAELAVALGCGMFFCALLALLS